jgi:uncharacterized protein (DUF302 family)
MTRLRRFSLIPLSVTFLCIVTVWLSPVKAEMTNTSHGLVQLTSDFSVAETGDRLAALLEERRLSVFARIDHAQNAASVGKDLRPTQLFIFGNPNVGTPLMQCNQSVGIDLPQKILIWQDESEHVHLAYNDPDYLLERHSLTDCKAVVERISQVLDDLAKRATQA